MVLLGLSTKPTVDLLGYFEPNVLVLEGGTPFIIENIRDINAVRMFAVSGANALHSMHSLVLTRYLFVDLHALQLWFTLCTIEFHRISCMQTLKRHNFVLFVTPIQ